MILPKRVFVVRWMMGLFVCIPFICLTATAAPQISRIEPLAVVPGKRTVLKVSGSGFDETTRLWTSLGGTTERLKSTQPGEILFSVDCPADASGIHAVQLHSGSGASKFELLMVDYLEALRSTGKNRKFGESMILGPPVAVDAVARADSADFYRFAGKAGESYSIEAIAHQIGSELDPVVRVLDATGKELVFCDDEGGIWRDARFRFTAPVHGEYTVEVHDAGFGGGANYAYRLRVSDDPLVWYTYPLPLMAYDSAQMEVFGIVASAKESPANPPRTTRIAGAVQVLEAEPNDEIAKALSFTVPVWLNGKVNDGNDIDLYKFKVEKDQRLRFQSETRSAGSPGDLALRILREDGSALVASAATTGSDAALTNQFAEAGTYLFEVRELSGSGVTNLPYRVKIDRFTPGFSLSVEDGPVEVPSAGSTKLKINVQRFEFKDSIQIKMEPAVEGIRIENSEIPANKNEIELLVKADEKVAKGVLQQVRFYGIATNGLSSRVNTRPALRKSFPLMLNPPPILEGLVTVIVVQK